MSGRNAGPSGASQAPEPGAVVWVGAEANTVHGHRPFRLRVIGHTTGPGLSPGHAYLDGYELNGAGEAVVRREVFVRLAGLRTATSVRTAVR